MKRTLARLVATLLLACSVTAATAQAPQAEPTQVVLHMLDYIAVDYAGAVGDGKVIDQAEFDEMREFSAQAIAQINGLPANDKREALARQADALAKLIEDKSAPPAVAEAARALRTAIIEAYNVRTLPATPPDTALGQRIYAENCAGCHGLEGRGDGAAAKGMDPVPSNFHHTERMSQRSLYGLYSTITLGVDGTAMTSFKHLSEHDRWSVAAYIAAFTQTARPSSLDTASRLLAEAVAAFEAGDAAKAQTLAIRAYLDGFEPVEASLANVDGELMRAIESDMIAFRAQLKPGTAAAEIERRAAAIETQLARARTLLGGAGLSPTATFTSSFLILLREGLEAIIVLAAIIAFVKKAGRRDALPYVHAGWIGAFVLGALTWVAATFLIEISGANREITEGVTALFAAAVLIYVGYWLHNKSYAHAWAQFIKEQVGSALNKRTWWAMAAVAFLAVYREMFEVVLFYQALWVQAAPQGSGAFFGGLAAAAAALGVIAWLIFRYSVRLPIGPFFAATSVLLALMAVVFAGQGVAALQEAGVVSITPVAFVALPVIGVFPTAQTLAAQVAMMLIVAASFYLASRAPRAA
jgi:high-affinity iron transporter